MHLVKNSKFTFSMSHQIIRLRVTELGGGVSVVVLRQAQEEVVVVFDDGQQVALQVDALGRVY